MWKHYESFANPLLEWCRLRGALLVSYLQEPASAWEPETSPAARAGTQTWRHMGGGKWVKSISSLKVAWIRAGHLNSENHCRKMEPSRAGWAHAEQFLRHGNLIRSDRMSHTSIVPWVKSISVSESQDKEQGNLLSLGCTKGHLTLYFEHTHWDTSGGAAL